MTKEESRERILQAGLLAAEQIGYQKITQATVAHRAEVSASLVGLSHRWAIRSVLVIGLFVTALAGFAVWLQSVIYLFGPKEVRFELMTLNWPEDLEKLASRARATKSKLAEDKAAARKATA